LNKVANSSRATNFRAELYKRDGLPVLFRNETKEDGGGYFDAQ